MNRMQQPPVIAPTGEVFLDARGDGRALRVAWHTEAGLVNLSLWRQGVCAGTFRLDITQVPDLIDVLRVGLAQQYHHTVRKLA